jgi:hypothetical protein
VKRIQILIFMKKTKVTFIYALLYVVSLYCHLSFIHLSPRLSPIVRVSIISESPAPLVVFALPWEWSIGGSGSPSRAADTAVLQANVGRVDLPGASRGAIPHIHAFCDADVGNFDGNAELFLKLTDHGSSE